MIEYMFKYQPSPELLNRAMRAWAKPQFTRRQKWGRIGIGVLLYVALMACVFALLRYDLVEAPTLLGGVVGMFLTVGFLVAMHQLNMRKIKGFTHDALDKHGATDARFRADGIELTSQISTARMDWLCFDDVLPLTDATVLRTGAVVYAIPDEALPHGVSPTQFRTDLRSWMEAAR